LRKFSQLFAKNMRYVPPTCYLQIPNTLAHQFVITNLTQTVCHVKLSIPQGPSTFPDPDLVNTERIVYHEQDPEHVSSRFLCKVNNCGHNSFIFISGRLWLWIPAHSVLARYFDKKNSAWCIHYGSHPHIFERFVMRKTLFERSNRSVSIIITLSMFTNFKWFSHLRHPEHGEPEMSNAKHTIEKSIVTARHRIFTTILTRFLPNLILTKILIVITIFRSTFLYESCKNCLSTVGP
jgi:hypothetical protein